MQLDQLGELVVKLPPATLVIKLLVAAPTSATVSIAGTRALTGRSLRGGTIRSRQSFIATPSPAMAISMHLRVSPSTSPSSKDSAAMIYDFRSADLDSRAEKAGPLSQDPVSFFRRFFDFRPNSPPNRDYPASKCPIISHWRRLQTQHRPKL
jgi:hypothetical protein